MADKGIAGRVLEHLAERLSPRTIGKEMLDTVTDKIIPQGASEVGQALFGKTDGFVVYGAGQEPLNPIEPSNPTPGPAEANGVDTPVEPPTMQQVLPDAGGKAQPDLKPTDVSEIGPPLATPMVKGQAVKQQQIDPLDQAREAARETSKGQGKSRQIEME